MHAHLVIWVVVKGVSDYSTFLRGAPAVGKVLTPPRLITYQRPSARRCKNFSRNYGVPMRTNAKHPATPANSTQTLCNTTPCVRFCVRRHIDRGRYGVDTASIWRRYGVDMDAIFLHGGGNPSAKIPTSKFQPPPFHTCTHT